MKLWIKYIMHSKEYQCTWTELMSDNQQTEASLLHFNFKFVIDDRNNIEIQYVTTHKKPLYLNSPLMGHIECSVKEHCPIPGGCSRIQRPISWILRQKTLSRFRNI